MLFDIGDLMDLFSKILIGILVLMLVALPFALVRFNNRMTACEQMGGTLLKTPDGYVCFKIERFTT